MICSGIGKLPIACTKTVRFTLDQGASLSQVGRNARWQYGDSTKCSRHQRRPKTLFVGITNHTNAKSLAVGMNHAGAVNVAQMDVNWSYPKFVTYEKGEDELLHPVALAKGFEFSDKLYLRERSMRDFFYLARKEDVSPKLPQSTRHPQIEAHLIERPLST